MKMKHVKWCKHFFQFRLFKTATTHKIYQCLHTFIILKHSSHQCAYTMLKVKKIKCQGVSNLLTTCGNKTFWSRVREKEEQRAAVAPANKQKGRRWKLRVRKRGHVILHQQNQSLSPLLLSPTLLFLPRHFFPPSQPPASYFQPVACTRPRAPTCVWVSAYRRWGWGGGGRAIKALLKHFWCCWPLLQLKESEKKEEKRRKKNSE